MKLGSHIIATLTISSVAYFIFNSFSAFISSLIGGILIDLDHLIDYYKHEGVNFKIKDFFDWCYELKWDKLLLFFHSIEAVFILWFLISIFNLGIFWIGLTIGVTQHMILDILGNSDIINLYSYFFTFRLVKGFKKEHLMRRA